MDGTYDFVGEVLTAVRAPGVMREDVLALRALALAVQAGQLGSEEAELKARDISPTFGNLWKWVNANSNGIVILIAILTLLVTIYAAHSADESSDQAHKDALLQYEATQQQIVETHSEQEIQESIYNRIYMRPGAGEAQELDCQTKVQGQRSHQTPVKTSRLKCLLLVGSSHQTSVGASQSRSSLGSHK